MRNAQLLILLAALSLLGACATPAIKVYSDYDSSVNFNAYRSFGFVPESGSEPADYPSLSTQRIKAAIRREMEARGYAYVDNEPELLISFNGKQEEQVDVSSRPAQPLAVGFYGYGRYAPWPGYAYEAKVDKYTKGTLNINLIDSRMAHVGSAKLAKSKSAGTLLRLLFSMPNPTAETFAKP